MADAISASRTSNIVLWVLRVLMAALFLFASFAKLTSNPMMVHEFALLPVGDWFRYFTGLLELVGAIALLTPAVSGLARSSCWSSMSAPFSLRFSSSTRTGFIRSSSARSSRRSSISSATRSAGGWGCKAGCG